MKAVSRINGHIVKFYVNKGKRTVAAVIKDCWDDVYDWVIYHGISTHAIKCSMTMQSSYSAKSKCSAEDEWDEELGKVIALQRLEEKYWLSFNRVLYGAMMDVYKHVTDPMMEKLERNLNILDGQRDINEIIEIYKKRRDGHE